jgi:hypothetical protein
MANATDQQMQSYADSRIRPFAEALRSLLAQAQDDLTAITDEFARAGAGPIWHDNRLDGPPHLLASGPGASPDDLTNFNQVLTDFVKFCTQLNNTTVSCRSGEVGILMRACVRAAG